MTKIKKNNKFTISERVKSIVGFARSHVSQLLFLGVILLCVFLRFYDLNHLNPFGWDQVDSAWAAVNIIINHNFPLLGTQAKENSGIFVGPLYYYLISIVYFFTNLDPIASGISAGIVSIMSVITIYFIVKKLFSIDVAIIAAFINTVAVSAIIFERVQWVVNFVPVLSLIIFYCLYKTMQGKSKYIIYLAIAVGFSFHIHFSSLFYFPIILFCLPFFPKNKKTLKYIGMGIIIFLIFMIPTIIALVTKSYYSANALQYGNSYYHGLHLRRIIQIYRDAFIQFEAYLTYNFLTPFSVLFLPVFVIYYYLRDKSGDKLKFLYLTVLFFIVPWIAMSTYSGEITDYYFSTTRFIALFIIAYFIYQIYKIRSFIPKVAVVLLLGLYAYLNVNAFLHSDKSNSVAVHREKALNAIKRGERIGFYEGVPDSYFYYYYMLKKGIKVY
jgi:4-amino-4-deoxy-L-arabinose transferase-like glycosyltransferase